MAQRKLSHEQKLLHEHHYTSHPEGYSPLLWPNDQLGIQDDAGNNVSDEEMEAARAAVRHGLSSALPASLIALIGRKPVEAGLRKAHDFTQCPRLVKNLLYEVLDLLVIELFPNVTMQELRGKA